MKPLSDKQLASRLEEEGLQLWIVGPGGSGLNMLAGHFDRRGIKSVTPTWESHACHRMFPVDVPGCKKLFVTAEPHVAVSSMVRQGVLGMNINKLLNYDSLHSGAVLRDARQWTWVFYMQMMQWSVPAKDTLCVRYENLWIDWEWIVEWIGCDIDMPMYVPRKSHPMAPGDPHLQIWKESLDEQPWCHSTQAEKGGLWI